MICTTFAPQLASTAAAAARPCADRGRGATGNAMFHAQGAWQVSYQWSELSTATTKRPTRLLGGRPT